MRLAQRISLCLIILACSAGMCACGIGKNEDSSVVRTITIVPVGNLPADLVPRVQSFVDRYYNTETRLVRGISSSHANLKELAGIVAKSTKRCDTFVLILAASVTSAEGDPLHAVRRIADNTALVDVVSLKPETPQAGSDPERHFRRVEKETMRALGELIGLEQCPNPRCCMSAQNTEQELDEKGRNLCPPCLLRSREILRKAGIAITSERKAPPHR